MAAFLLMESMILPVLMSNLKNIREKQISFKNIKKFRQSTEYILIVTQYLLLSWGKLYGQSSKIALKKDQFLPARICLQKGQIFAILGKFAKAWILKLSKIALKKDEFLPQTFALKKVKFLIKPITDKVHNPQPIRLKMRNFLLYYTFWTKF